MFGCICGDSISASVSESCGQQVSVFRERTERTVREKVKKCRPSRSIPDTCVKQGRPKVHQGSTKGRPSVEPGSTQGPAKVKPDAGSNQGRYRVDPRFNQSRRRVDPWVDPRFHQSRPSVEPGGGPGRSCFDPAINHCG